jgi:hypothetical protein
VLEDAERLVAAWNERQAQTNAVAILANNRRRHCSAILFPVDTLPGLPNDQCD